MANSHIYIDCPNCDTESIENFKYCPICGQENIDLKISFKEWITTQFKEYFKLDKKIGLTLLPILTKPGQITLDFLNGKRARYIEPFKLYGLISFFVFFIISITNNKNLGNTLQRQLKERTISGSKFNENLLKLGRNTYIDKESAFKIYYNKKSLDSINKVMYGDEGFIRAFFSKIATKYSISNNFFTEKELESEMNKQKSIELKYTSYLLFLFMPFIALLLLRFFYSKGMYYYEHLIFSVYLHCAFFIIFILYFLASKINNEAISENFQLLLCCAVPIYSVLSLRRVYQQKLSLTIIKFIGVSIIYIAFFTISFMFIKMISF